MKTLHLFAGAGGGLLADLILGHQPIGAVEIDPYCCAVLRQRADDGWFPGLRVHEGDIRLFDPSDYSGRVDCIAGGFPCQDISAAGKGAGIAGERSGLWAEFARVIGVVRPRFAFIENSPMLTLRGLDVVLSDLAAMGFDAEWAVISAADAGAPHLRERIWILANARSGRLHGPRERKIQQPGRAEVIGGSEAVADATNQRWRQGGGEPGRREGRPSPIKRGPSMANAHRIGMEKRLRENWQPTRTQGQQGGAETGRSGWWQSEPDVGRVAAKLAHRVDRLKALGNGQVPMQAALAWRVMECRMADRLHG